MFAQPVCKALAAPTPVPITGSYSKRVSLFGALNHESNVGIAESERLAARSQRLRYEHPRSRQMSLGQTGDNFHADESRASTNSLSPAVFQRHCPLHPVVKTNVLSADDRNDKIAALDPINQIHAAFYRPASRSSKRPRAARFFLYVGPPSHSATCRFFAIGQIQGPIGPGPYAYVIEELDSVIGGGGEKVLAAIERNGLAQKLWLIFCQHNWAVLVLRHPRQPRPFAQGKLTTFRRRRPAWPCIIVFPGKIHAPNRGELLSTLDFLPTPRRWSGGKLSAIKIDGQDRWPLSSGRPRQAARNVYYYPAISQRPPHGPWGICNGPHE